jgi:DNA-binding XRE family transcriptional regulator
MVTSPTECREQRMVNGVRSRRQALGMSLSELARRSTVNRLTLRMIERNDGYAPSGTVMLLIAQALSQSVQDLFWSEAAA